MCTRVIGGIRGVERLVVDAVEVEWVEEALFMGIEEAPRGVPGY
jgi:hypothetical protein